MLHQYKDQSNKYLSTPEKKVEKEIQRLLELDIIKKLADQQVC